MTVGDPIMNYDDAIMNYGESALTLGGHVINCDDAITSVDVLLLNLESDLFLNRWHLIKNRAQNRLR
jgi:hypothetical protein